MLPTPWRQCAASWRVTLKGGGMVFWRVAELLKHEKMTAYRLVQRSGLAPTVVYRLAKAGCVVRRVDGKTLDILCATLGCQPGDLLEYVENGAKPKGHHSKPRG